MATSSFPRRRTAPGCLIGLHSRGQHRVSACCWRGTLPQVLAGPDPSDPLTQLSEFLTFPMNYTRYLDVNGLKVGGHLALGAWTVGPCHCGLPTGYSKM